MIKNFQSSYINFIISYRLNSYHRLLWKFFSENNIPIHIGNAAHIKKSFGIARGKDDKIDSQRLCSYAYKNDDELKATSALNPVFISLKDLITSRTRLKAQLGANRPT